jgi:hypothetical protein
MNLKVCYLKEQHRQTDSDIIKVLKDIRCQNVNEETLEIIFSRQNKKIKGMEKPTRLCTHNVDVDAINEAELAKIKGDSYTYKMTSKGEDYFTEVLRKGCMAPEKLVLKKGALVMFVKNNFEAGYVNGTQGEVVDFDDKGMPIVKILSGEKIVVDSQVWEINEDEKVKARIKQVPLRLAWAITVHKSQGMSLDAAEIDLGKSFAFGMGYVALSRVRSIEGIKLLGINEMSLAVNKKAAKFDEQLQEQSAMAELEIKSMDAVAKRKKQLDFLKKITH